MFWIVGAIVLAFYTAMECAYQRCERGRGKRFVEHDAPTLEDWIRMELGESHVADCEVVRRVLEVISKYIRCKPTQLCAADCRVRRQYFAFGDKRPDGNEAAG